jgi:DNA-binding transcriptional ArsR family regulator
MRSGAPSLLPIFRSQHQAELLTAMLLHPDRQYTLTELSTKLKAPVTTLQREVGRLVEAGLLTERRVGRSRLLAANPANRYAGPLTQLVALAFGPIVVVEEEYRGIDGVDAVAIYGSWAARYAGEPGPPPNDLDVLVIGGPDRTLVYEAADRIERRLDLPVGPTVCSRRRWAQANDALIQQVRSSPLAWVLGDPDGLVDA